MNCKCFYRGNYGDPSFAIERVLGHLRPSSKSREGFGVELSATLQRRRGELGGGDLRQEELAEEAKRMSRERAVGMVTDTDIRARPKSDGAVGHSGQKWTHRG